MYDGLISSTGSAAEPPPLLVPHFGATEFRRHAKRGFMRFGAALALSIVAIACAVVFPQHPFVPGLAFGLTCFVASLGLVEGVRALSKARSPQIPKGVPILVAVFPILCGAFMTLLGAACAFFSTVQFSRGRQLRRRGRILLPKVVPLRTWLAKDAFENGPPLVRTGIADQWRENGRTEHASVAACARLTLDLMALGAPPRLIKATQEDALDEIRHTELCFSLARSLDGREMSPGPFPEAQASSRRSRVRIVALAQLAVDSLVDGALHEGLSAAVIAKVAQRASFPEVRTMLMGIARDEGRHAAHGWDVVEWCLAEGGDAVVSALRGAMLTLPERTQHRRPAAAMSGEWESFGIHSQALEDREFARIRASLQGHLAALLGEEMGRPAA